MTRIHKKPGSDAWRKALRKSASRMVRDRVRAKDESRMLLGKYLAGKSTSERKALLEGGILKKMAEKRVEKAERIWKEHKQLDRQLKELVKGGQFNLSKLLASVFSGKPRETLKNLKSFRATTEAGITKFQDYIKNSLWLEKNMSKEFTEYLKRKRKEAEDTLQVGQKALKQINENIKKIEEEK